MVADGPQSLVGETGPGSHDVGTEALAVNIDDSRFFWQGLVASSTDDLSNIWNHGGIPNGINADGTAAYGLLRFRHGGEEVVNSLFVDGHASGNGYQEMTIGATR